MEGECEPPIVTIKSREDNILCVMSIYVFWIR